MAPLATAPAPIAVPWLLADEPEPMAVVLSPLALESEPTAVAPLPLALEPPPAARLPSPSAFAGGRGAPPPVSPPPPIRLPPPVPILLSAVDSEARPVEVEVDNEPS
ncbi:hypothetical protein BEN78_08650 [Xanthomonas citri pv. mangiferaeindicae]|nr:hypothetical protein BEN78_08650 [Xanthomonas citri pv. mangiferaeindicae]